MPWTPDRYPPSMSHLPEPVREKAIQIAKAQLGGSKEVNSSPSAV